MQKEVPLVRKFSLQLFDMHLKNVRFPSRIIDRAHLREASPLVLFGGMLARENDALHA